MLWSVNNIFIGLILLFIKLFLIHFPEINHFQTHDMLIIKPTVLCLSIIWYEHFEYDNAGYQ